MASQRNISGQNITLEYKRQWSVITNNWSLLGIPASLEIPSGSLFTYDDTPPSAAGFAELCEDPLQWEHL